MATFDLSDDEVAVLQHLLEADCGWGEPFKDFERYDVDTDKTMKSLLRKFGKK